MIGSRSTGSRSIALSRITQTNTVSARGPTNLRLVALWTMPLASLSTASSRNSEAARHPRGHLARGQPHDEAAQHAERDREEDRVVIDDREIDQSLRLAGAEMGQVVNDVFTG